LSTVLEIGQVDVLEVTYPFLLSFGHARASRSASRNVVVRVQARDGTVGFGEGVPRDYVTGETPAGAAALIADDLAPRFIGARLERFEDLPGLIAERFAGLEAGRPSSAARCAIELAVLDAGGRAFRRSVGELLGPLVRPEVTYSGVLPLLPAPLMYAGALLHRALGVNTLKLKVGRSLSEDLRNLRLLRAALGPGADLRVDVNCAWTVEQAIHSIQALERYGLSVVEQPVDKDDFDGLKRVSQAVEVAVMADESLRTIEDAERLAGEQIVDMFNLRISKCGGLLAAQRMAQIAAEAGLACQLGTHPGESVILAAAGRQFATRTRALRYLETPGNILLKRDVARDRLLPRRGGLAPALSGPGLGVEVEDSRIEPFICSRRRVA
jgi:muconate cycloisomerase